MRRLIALLLTMTLICSLAACSSDDDKETASASETETTLNEETEETENLTTEESVTDSTGASETTTASEVSQSDKITQESKTKETEKTEKTEKATTAKAPSTTAEVLKAYNNAVNGAYSAKAGFSKERYTDNATMDMSVALKAFKSLVEKFVGIGDDNRYSETVTKGKWDSDAKHEYLRKSTLTASDINSATCKTEGKYYILTLNIKNGSSVGSKGKTTSSCSLDKCGICVGNEDKNYYDHKTGPVIYDAIAGTYEGASVAESYKNAKAVAKVNAETGKIVSLTVTFDISVDIDINIGKGTATGSTHVLYKDFKF